MKFLVHSLFILFVSTSFFAQVDRSIMPKPGKASIININESQVFTLANGLTVIVSENHKIPKVSFDLRMGSDPQLEGDLAGLSDLAGSMLLSGTKSRSKDQLDNEIDYIGANLNADKNSIFLSCLTKHIDKGLELMSDVLRNASFPQSEFDRIKKQNESALLSTKSDASSMAKNATVKINFPSHPYGEVMTEASLNAIKLNDIENYFKATFSPKGAYLSIVGDITRAEAEKLANNYFSSWSGPTSSQAELAGRNKNAGNRVIFVNKPGAVQSVIYLSFPIDIKPGDNNQIPLTVLNGIFGGGGFGTRLMHNLREDKAFTYGCYSRLNITENGSWLSAGGNFRNAVSDSAITEILKELNIITTELVTDDELNLIKSSMNGDFSRSLESPQTIARFAYNIIKYNLDPTYYKTYLQRIEAITKEEVQQMAKKYFNVNNCNIIVVGNEEVVDKIKKFDADGKIEILDAFGDYKLQISPSDISKEELIERYLSVVTVTKSAKERAKKLKKVKTFIRITDLSSPSIPIPLKRTEYWIAPMTEASKMEGQGMVFQSSYFDGSNGFESNMQTGKKALSSEEIIVKKKSTGLFPEMYFAKNGVNYEVLGIENVDGKDCYVMKVTDETEENFAYFEKDTYLKVKTISIQKKGEEVQEASSIFSDFKEVNGLLFPHAISFSAGPMTISGKASKIAINEKIDLKEFQD